MLFLKKLSNVTFYSFLLLFSKCLLEKKLRPLVSWVSDTRSVLILNELKILNILKMLRSDLKNKNQDLPNTTGKKQSLCDIIKQLSALLMANSQR